VFGRKKDEPQSPVNVESAQQAPETTDGRKTGPTPKRNAQQANRQRPLVPTDRKAAKEAQRQQRVEAQNRLRLANETGDERYLMPRDKGEQKRYTRNFIDSRWMFGEFMMFIILAFLVVSLVFQRNLQIQMFVQAALWEEAPGRQVRPHGKGRTHVRGNAWNAVPQIAPAKATGQARRKYRLVDTARPQRGKLAELAPF